MYFIDRDTYQAQQSVNSRIRFLILHFTTLNFADSIHALTQGQVSSHYVVADPDDSSYRDAGFEQVRIFQLVDEQLRAWHAGESYWAGRIHLNDSAIGIEIVNAGYAQPPHYYFPEFNPYQIEATIKLCQSIISRYPDIAPHYVLGHSDIAVGRKYDPGAAFPWLKLHHAGIGAWFDQATVLAYQQQFQTCLPDRATIIQKFKQYGYDTRHADQDDGYHALVRAFQLHFRATCYDGHADAETLAILYALVDKYCD